MFKDYCDSNHECIINFIGNVNEGEYGINKIQKIFLITKNNIAYDMFCNLQHASETLVFSRGSNIDKALLLYTLLTSAGFDCDLCYAIVKDNSRLISKSGKNIKWFYVTINYFGKLIELDCSFDRSFMNAAKIRHMSKSVDFKLENYIYKNEKLFNVVKRCCINMEERNDEFCELVFTNY